MQQHNQKKQDPEHKNGRRVCLGIAAALFLWGCGAASDSQNEVGDGSSSKISQSRTNQSSSSSGSSKLDSHAKLPAEFPNDVYLSSSMEVQMAQQLPKGFSILGQSSEQKPTLLSEIRTHMTQTGWQEQADDAQAQLMQATRFKQADRVASYSLFEGRNGTGFRLDVYTE